MLHADHCFRERSIPGGSSFGSLTSSLLAMSLSVQRLHHLSFVSNHASLKTFAEPQKGLHDSSRIFGRFCRSSWIRSSGLVLMQSNSLSILTFERTSGGGLLDRTGSLCTGVDFSVLLIIRISVFRTVSQMFCVAVICPNRRTVFRCRVHKSKARSATSACTRSQAGTHQFPDDVYPGLDRFRCSRNVRSPSGVTPRY